MKTVSKYSRVCVGLTFVAASLGLLSVSAQAQTVSYNPFMVQGIVGEDEGVPSTLWPVEFNGAGVLAMDIGNTGDSPLDDLSSEQRMRVIITLSKGVPNVTTPSDPEDALNALGGVGASWFDWTYDPSTTTYEGIQNQVISAQSRETITVQYKVTENIFAPATQNGFNANITPPFYTSGQPTSDDAVSAYTSVAASDYGDAPSTYGIARHNVDLEQRTDGRYLRYVRIGQVVDPETQMQSSDGAVDDDYIESGGLNADDEDGVVFPEMNPGEVGVEIPVTLFFPSTFMTHSFLHVWIDWDQNGAFEADEKVYQSSSGTRTSGVVNVAVDVPAAIPVDYYYARFRVGPDENITADDYLGPTGEAAWGEVEDHIFPVGTPAAVAMGDVDLTAKGVPDFLNEIGGSDLDRDDLLGLLSTWDPFVAANLQHAGRAALLDALREYLDPDGDGQVVVFRWETLEERGTIGFYAERLAGETWSKINVRMLPGLIAAPMGAQYRLADPGAQVGDDYQYRLIELDAWGKTNEYGPFDLRATSP